MSDFIRSISFTIPGQGNKPSVNVTATEVDGAIVFTVEMDSISQNSADLRGLFFNLNNTTKLKGLTFFGDDVSKFSLVNVIDLGKGANMHGAAAPFDAGVMFGSPGIGKDTIQSTSFTLTNSDNNLTLDDIANVEFGARTTSVGGKLVVTAPAAPDANNDAYTIFEDGQLNLDSPSHIPLGTVFQVLSNDTDADLDVLTITDLRQPLHGTVEIVDGDDDDELIGDAILYTPDADYSGTDSFEYLISDNNGGTDFAKVDVSIIAVADNPSFTVETYATANINEVRFVVTASQEDYDLSEFIDRIVVDSLPDGVSISPLQSNSVEQPDSYSQEFLLVLPSDTSVDFDLTFKAFSKEESNGDEQESFETIRVATSVVTSQSQVSWHTSSTTPFSYNDFSALRGFSTDGLQTTSATKDVAFADATASASINIETGLQEDFDLGSGSLDLNVDQLVTVDSYFNSLTDVLEIKTTSAISNASWSLQDPSAFVELSAILKFYAQASLHLEFASWVPLPDVNLYATDFPFIGQTLYLLNQLNIDAPIITFNNNTVPDGILDLTIANPALINDKGELPSFLDFISVFYEKPGDISGSLDPFTDTSTLLSYDFDIDELLWNIFELAYFPSLTTEEGQKLFLAGLALDWNLNPFNLEATIPGTGLFLDLELLDFDVNFNYEFNRYVDLELGDLIGKLIFEDGFESESFVFGDTLSFENASIHDSNLDGLIDFTVVVEQSGYLTHKVNLDPEGEFVITALDLRAGYDGTFGTVVASVPEITLVSKEFNTGDAFDVYDDAYNFLIEDTLALSIDLVGTNTNTEAFV